MSIFGGVALIKILFTLFALFAWSRAILRFYRKDLSWKELLFWSLVWLAMIVLVFIPGKTNFLAKALGMERGNDAMFFLAIVGLLYASYRLYVKSNEMEKEITRLVRALALKNIKQSKSLSRRKSKRTK
ncbi:MAG: DUF2304 domain-containing protein [Patescibacteria group bacterium]